MSEQIDWPRLVADLAAPFTPELVQWRPAGKAGPSAHVELVAYLEAATVQDRLDAVCGVAWSFELEPVVVAGGELMVARGRLRIYDRVRDGIGTATNWEPSKGCASDALKRAAALWGVGRYLASLPQVRCQLDAKGEIPSAMLDKLREALRRRMPAPATAGAA
ncbi:MAG TPA: Rad52/Rad22 family DNA repair protein [Ktedonobacterales bacterium]|nr:Rad52/Rad22 family DNA repair protein [Ktedonobacterales bacterium]